MDKLNNPKPVGDITTKQIGDQLEKRVMNILKMEGRWNIRNSVHIKDKNGNLSEIDIVYGLFNKKYVECKNYSNSIELDKVAKFKEVLRLNKVNPKKGLFVTTSTYSPRATTIGIKCIDGTELKNWESKAKYLKRRRFSRNLLLLSSLSLCAAFYFNIDTIERYVKVPNFVTSAVKNPILTIESSSLYKRGQESVKSSYHKFIFNYPIVQYKFELLKEKFSDAKVKMNSLIKK